MSKFKIGDTVIFNPKSIKEWINFNQWYKTHELTDKDLYSFRAKIILIQAEGSLIRIKNEKYEWLFNSNDLLLADEFCGPIQSPIILKIKYLDDRYANRHSHA